MTEEKKIEKEREGKIEAKKEEKKVELKGAAKEIMDKLEKMTVIELSDFVKALEEKFDISAQGVPMAVPGMAMATAGTDAGQAAQEEKTAYTVVLAEVGSNKIQVIKEIRAITTLGLKEAKELVESAPKSVKEGATKEDADKIKTQLEKAGAKVELK